MRKIRKSLSVSSHVGNLKNNQVVVNAGFLFVTQFINFAFPLITLKYLLSVIGVKYFGKVSFALAFTNYFILLVDFGFNISATKLIAINKESPLAIAKIFYTTYLAKLILMLLSFGVFILCIWQLNVFDGYHFFYLSFFGIVAGLMLFPQWFFQGIEKMGYITLVNALIKIVFLFAIFVVVKNQNDYLYLPLLYSLSYILPGIYAFLVARRLARPLMIPTIRDVVKSFSEGIHVFISTAVNASLSVSSIFILGLLSNENIVGYYAGYDRLAKAASMLFAPITLAIYPTVAKRFALSYTAGYLYIKKIAIPTMLLAILLAILLVLFSGLLTKYIYQPDFEKYKIILYILSAWFVFNLLNNFIGTQYLSANGKSNIYARSSVISGVFSLFLLYFLTLSYSYTGTALSVLFSEILLSLVMVFFILIEKKREAFISK